MKLEDYFKQNLQRFNKKIVELQNKYPALSYSFNIDKDPHIEHMINAFTLIGSDLQYKQNQKINRETKSIIYNFPTSEFNTSPPIGILKLIPDEKTQVKSGATINCSGSIFKSLYNHCISKIEIQEVKKEDKNIKITFSKPVQEIERIDLYCEYSILNKIFINKNVVDIVVINREQYKTTAKCVLNSNLDLKNLLHFKDSQCFISICDLNLKGTSDFFSILIPCAELENIDMSSFETNCIFIENRYLNYTSPFLVPNSSEYPLRLENNDSLITVKRVLDEKTEIPHISENHTGWYLIKDSDAYLLHIGSATGKVYAEVECYSENISYELTPFFEEFIPTKLKWFIKPGNITNYYNTDEVAKIIKLFYQEVSLKEYVYTLIDFINLNDKKITLKNVMVIDSVKPVFVGKYVISQVGKIVHIECETTDYILLKSLSKNIRDKYEHFVDIIFYTENYKIVIEEEFIKPLTSY